MAKKTRVSCGPRQLSSANMPGLKKDFKKAVYAGSFSPITKGHHDIIVQAAKAFDELHIVVGVNHNKTPLFTPDERVKMIEDDVKKHIQPLLKSKGIECDIKVASHEGATVRFMEAVGAPFYVRGLRLGTEFDQEFPSVMVNKDLYPDFTPVFFCSTNTKTQTISSTVAREVCALGEDEVLENYVTPHVKDKLVKKMKELKLRP